MTKSNLLFWIFFCLSISLQAQAKRAQVVQINHSLRWVEERTIPNYFNYRYVKDSVLQTIANSLVKYLKCDEVLMPQEVGYQVIMGFGKAKNKFPKTIPTAADYYISINSAITRATTGYAIYWDIDIIIRDKSGVILNNKIRHEIEPVSASLYFKTARWLGQSDFIRFICQTTDEVLGLRPLQPKVIRVGSAEDEKHKLDAWLPNRETFLMLRASTTSGHTYFEIQKDSTLINLFKVKEGAVITKGRLLNKDRLVSGILSGVTGFNVSYTVNEEIERRATVTFDPDQERKIRFNYIIQTEQWTRTDRINVSLASPIVGEVFWKDDLYGQFVYVQETDYSDTVRTGKQKLNLWGGWYTENEMSMGPQQVQRLEGHFRGKKFEIQHAEFDNYILVSVDNVPAAYFSLFNLNEKVAGYQGQRLSRNKSFLTPSVGGLKDKEKAEVYTLYLIQTEDAQLLEDIMQIYSAFVFISQ
ncbi:MAG: hypothetical protein KF763_11165 [Cyclobacteriaceae bacterium]|nr:hypothetical protein [Cyclobacteriaceae bacterium]